MIRRLTNFTSTFAHAFGKTQVSGFKRLSAAREVICETTRPLDQGGMTYKAFSGIITPNKTTTAFITNSGKNCTIFLSGPLEAKPAFPAHIKTVIVQS